MAESGTKWGALGHLTDPRTVQLSFNVPTTRIRDLLDKTLAMSSIENHQWTCQNCHGFDIKAETLRKLVAVVDTLQAVFNSIQPIINNLQPIINDLQPIINDLQPTIEGIPRSILPRDHNSVSSGDGNTDDSEDGDEDTLDHDSKCVPSLLRCPHEKCQSDSSRHTYTTERSLIRHFGSRKLRSPIAWLIRTPFANNGVIDRYEVQRGLPFL